VIQLDQFELQAKTIYSNLEIQLKLGVFSINLIYFVIDRQSKDFDLGKDDYFHLIYFKDGNANLISQGKKSIIPKNSFLYFTPNQIRLENPKQKNLISYHICFELINKKTGNKLLSIFEEEPAQLFKTLSQRDAYQLIQDKTTRMDDLFEEIVSEFESNLYFQRYKLRSLFLNVFVSFARAIIKDSRKKQPNIKSSSTNFLHYVITDLMRYRYKTLTLPELADILKMSKRQLQRHIKEYLGMTFKKKLVSVRIMNAKRLIQTTNLSIAEISEEVGFKNTLYFIRVYKEREGMTPNNYRKSLK